jgi:hypothetical protein
MLSHVNLWKFAKNMPKLWIFKKLYESYEILLKLC